MGVIYPINLKDKVFLCYLPIQKSLKILSNNSSTLTYPTISPRFLTANLKSSAAKSIWLIDFLLIHLLMKNTVFSRLFLCLCLEIILSSLTSKWSSIFFDIVLTRLEIPKFFFCWNSNWFINFILEKFIYFFNIYFVQN